MSEEQPSSSSDAKDVNIEGTPKELGNPLGIKARNDIYERFDKQYTQPTDLSDKEESTTEEDLKEPSGPEQHSEQVVDTEKPTSVKKGKEPKSEDAKMVPLQALHEARERFRKLNLESRDYKTQTSKEIEDLKEQVKRLQTALESSNNTDINDVVDTEDPKIKALKDEVAQLKKRYHVDEQTKAKEAALKAQEDQQKQLLKVTKELTDEGYPGFDIAVFKTQAKLIDLVNSGDITVTESQDPEVWKKVFKEEVFQDVKRIFTEKDKEELMDRKKQAKKKANLVSDPGKAPEKTEDEEDKAPTYEEFVKSGVQDRLDAYKKQFYKRK